MALSGLGMVGFVLAHMLGNLQIFLGKDAFNSYAALIKGMPELLWVARIGLIAFVFLHIITGISLARENRAARPKNYAYKNTVQASLASRISLPTGMIILIFIAIHLAHFTLFFIHPEFASYTDLQGRHDAYRMVIEGFRVSSFAWFYVLAMLCLGYHLSHGISSVFQTLGISSKKLRPKLRLAAIGISAIVVLGFIAVPISVQLGII